MYLIIIIIPIINCSFKLFFFFENFQIDFEHNFIIFMILLTFNHTKKHKHTILIYFNNHKIFLLI